MVTLKLKSLFTISTALEALKHRHKLFAKAQLLLVDLVQTDMSNISILFSYFTKSFGKIIALDLSSLCIFYFFMGLEKSLLRFAQCYWYPQSKIHV